MQLIAATIFSHEGNYAGALKAVHGLVDLQQCVFASSLGTVFFHVVNCDVVAVVLVRLAVRYWRSVDFFGGFTRECESCGQLLGCRLAMAIQVSLKISRIDVAQKHFKKMQTTDDESTLTQLCSAWINLALVRQAGNSSGCQCRAVPPYVTAALFYYLFIYFCVVRQGGDKYVEARYTFQELSDKFGASVTLLNGLAACHMCMGHYEDAERLLIDAIGKVRCAGCV